jgi:thioredoxin-related protein
MVKPIVDRLEADLGDRARVVRLDVWSSTGKALGSRFGVRAVPTFVLIGKGGETLYRGTGLLDSNKIKRLTLETIGRK